MLPMANYGVSFLLDTIMTIQRVINLVDGGLNDTDIPVAHKLMTSFMATEYSLDLQLPHAKRNLFSGQFFYLSTVLIMLLV